MSTFSEIRPSNITSLDWNLDDSETFPSDVFMWEGEVFPFTITVAGSNAPSSPANELYKDRADYSATGLSGSASASGQVITTKTVTAQTNDAGTDYALITQATISGNTRKVKTIIHILDRKDA